MKNVPPIEIIEGNEIKAVVPILTNEQNETVQDSESVQLLSFLLSSIISSTQCLDFGHTSFVLPPVKSKFGLFSQAKSIRIVAIPQQSRSDGTLMEGNSKGPTKIKGKNSKPKAMIDPDLNSN
jgi:hypothetical protein